MFHYPEPLAKLVAELQKLPSIGEKTAQRIAMHILRGAEEDAKLLGHAIAEVKGQITYCSICGGITERDPCRICDDPRRNHKVLCIVEETHDLIAMERTGLFNGVYHVLMGALSPLEGIGPEDLRIGELFKRINSQDVEEIIMATNPNATGQATALYLSRKIRPMGIKITQLAHGLPMGVDIDYVHEVTLGKALEGRREL
jgi:recombination protein RecR